jgi:hypothetical protein
MRCLFDSTPGGKTQQKMATMIDKVSSPLEPAVEFAIHHAPEDKCLQDIFETCMAFASLSLVKKDDDSMVN